MSDAFASRKAVQAIVRSIHELAPTRGRTRVMHVCGSHEHSLVEGGLRSLLPESVELIAGPGCPVCVCPEHEVREAIAIARGGAVLATYGDMLRVPTSDGSLLDAAAAGATVKLVYSPADAVKLAAAHPEREVVFFAIGFETTAAPTAALLGHALPANFSILCSHRLTPPAMELLLDSGEIRVDGLIAPGHVSIVIGAQPWGVFPQRFGLPTVVAGFEPVDILLGLREVLAQRRRGEVALANTYGRAVRPAGNARAAALLDAAFEVTPSHWRGLGELPGTGLSLRPEHAGADARAKLGVRLAPGEGDMPKGCACNRVMLGQIKPPECPLFRTACHPSRPYGPCMVSLEGTCYLWHQYGDGAGQGLAAQSAPAAVEV